MPTLDNIVDIGSDLVEVPSVPWLGRAVSPGLTRGGIYLLAGEPGIGNWTVIVKDTVVNELNGTFINWKLNLWGESIDPDKAVLLPMPTEQDDDDNGDIPSVATTVTVATTTIEVPSAPAGTIIVPTDHIDRPINSKPSATSDPETTTLPSSTPSPSSTATFLDPMWLKA